MSDERERVAAELAEVDAIVKQAREDWCAFGDDHGRRFYSADTRLVEGAVRQVAQKYVGERQRREQAERERDTYRDDAARLLALLAHLPEGYAVGDDATAELAVQVCVMETRAEAAEAENAKLREGLRQLADQWERDVLTYPKNWRDAVSGTRMAAQELRDKLALLSPSPAPDESAKVSDDSRMNGLMWAVDALAAMEDLPDCPFCAGRRHGSGEHLDCSVRRAVLYASRETLEAVKEANAEPAKHRGPHWEHAIGIIAQAGVDCPACSAAEQPAGAGEPRIGWGSAPVALSGYGMERRRGQRRKQDISSALLCTCECGAQAIVHGQEALDHFLDNGHRDHHGFGLQQRRQAQSDRRGSK